MKHSIRTMAMLGLAAVMAAPATGRADEETDMKVWRESVEERLKGLHNEAAEVNNVHMDFFSDLRADYVDSPRTNSGSSGFYNRRAESKFFGMIQPNVTGTIGFDFAELKLKDAGIEITELPLIPFFGGPETSVKIGQYRLPFGIETQTSSSAIFFAERSMLNGGAGGTKLVGERAMGIQGKTKVKTGIIDVQGQFGGFNNLSEDNASGQNKLAGAFPKQNTDQDLSWAGRLGLTHAYLGGLLPEKSELTTGFSYGRDSQNSAWRAQNNAIKFEELVGADLVFKLGKQLALQAEWVRRGTYTSNGSGVASAAFGESHYGTLAYDILPFLSDDIQKGDALQLLVRMEQEMSEGALGAVEKNRLVGGIKNSYWGGKSHTALNYYVTASNGQFGGTKPGGPDTMIVLQQQFAFHTGKAKWMEPIGE